MTSVEVKVPPKPQKEEPKQPHNVGLVALILVVTTITGAVFGWFQLKNEQERVQALLGEACQAEKLSDLKTLEAYKRKLDEANNIVILSKIPILGSQELLANYNSCQQKIKAADNFFAQLKILVAEFRKFSNDKPLTSFDIPKYSERLNKLEKQFSDFTNQPQIIQEGQVVWHLRNALDHYKLGLQARLDCQKGNNCFPASFSKEPSLDAESDVARRLLQDYGMKAQLVFYPYQDFFLIRPAIKLKDAMITLENAAQESIAAAESHLY
ncbi:MAG: hypothetical protein N2235_13115 [Fischerella sp.]|nr:hypothetical protein [Fischerella sp.]